MMAYTRTYDIPYFLVDQNRNLRITALMQFLEDMAIRHSEECGVGLDFYAEQQVAWVLAKWDIEIFKLPEFNELIHVLTQPVSFRSISGFRHFRVTDEQENLLATANSLWILIDMKRKRPIPVSETLIRAYGLAPDQKTPLPIQAPKPPENDHYLTHITIRPGDIDTNQHVNNIRYAEWALDSLPVDFTAGKKVKRILVDYRKELREGDDVTVKADVNGQDGILVSRHTISGGTTAACHVNFFWENV